MAIVTGASDKDRASRRPAFAFRAPGTNAWHLGSVFMLRRQTFLGAQTQALVCFGAEGVRPVAPVQTGAGAVSQWAGMSVGAR